MKKVKKAPGPRGHVVGSDRIAAFEAVRIPAGGPASLALSGIAAAVSLAVPFGRVAQAAPTASYMVAANRFSAVSPGHPDQTFLVAQRFADPARPGLFTVGADAGVSSEFSRIAAARAGSSEVSAPAAKPRKTGKRRHRSGDVKRASVISRDSRGVLSHKSAAARALRGPSAPTRRMASAGVAAVGKVSYESTRGAFSKPLYRGTNRSARAPAAAGNAPHFLSTSFTSADGRTVGGGVTTARFGVSNPYRSAEHDGATEAPQAPTRDGPGTLDVTLDGAHAVVGAQPPSGDAPSIATGNDADYAAPWSASAAQGNAQTSMAARAMPPLSMAEPDDRAPTSGSQTPQPQATADGQRDVDVVQTEDEGAEATQPRASASVPASANPDGPPEAAQDPSHADAPDASGGQTAPDDAHAASTPDPSAALPTPRSDAHSARPDESRRSASVDQPRATPDIPAPEDAQIEHIEQIRFAGNTVFDASALLEASQLFPTDRPSSHTGSDAYSKEKLAVGLEKIRRLYLDRGYLEFEVESVQTSVAPDGRHVSLSIALHEGERYTFSRIAIEGAPPELKTALSASIDIRVGEAVPLGKLQTGATAIVAGLRDEGYTRASVSPLSKVDSDKRTVDLTLLIDPGRRATVRRVSVKGNAITREDVVRRAIGASEGDVYNPRKIAAARARLRRLGYFAQVDVNATPVEGAPDQVDLSLDVVEQSNAVVTLGAGFSTAERVVGNSSFKYNNLFGTGQSIAADFSLARTFQTIDVTQTDPFFTLSGVSRTVHAYVLANEPLYYSSDSRFRINTLGVSLGFDIPLSERSKLDVGAAVEHTRLDTDQRTPQAYLDYVHSYGRDSVNVPVKVEWSIDRRDGTWPARSGYQAAVGVEYGTPAGTNQYYKVDGWAKYDYPLMRDVVLAASVRGGYGNAVGHRPYPLVKNYFAGGIGSVRGYEPTSLSPRDVKTGEPIGGSKMFAGSVELHFPLPQIARKNGVSALAFVDGGNVWGAQGPSVGANGMRFSYGVGLAWNSRFGSVKTSVGFPIVRHQFDRYQKIQLQFDAVF